MIVGSIAKFLIGFSSFDVSERDKQMLTTPPQVPRKTIPQEPVEKELGNALVRTLTAYMAMRSLGLLEKNSASQ